MLSSLFEMVRKRPSGERQPRPVGTAVAVDNVWKRRIQDRMRERDVTSAQIARDLGVKQSAITHLFKPIEEGGAKASRLVPKIHKLLDLVEVDSNAQAVERDDLWRQMKRLWSDLSDAQREHLIATGQMFATKR